ncbi:MAG TPA: hypothetical protein VFW90_00800 [Candidatus Saccharimonadales bacterium]|nr:hypothetical protein [Candidatus Saccharimonadales bacterium]
MMIYAISKLSVVFFLGDTLTPCTPANTHFFFLPTWWKYLNTYYDPLGQCSPAFTDANGTFHLIYILFVGLAVIDMLLRLAGFVAVVSIIASGAQYIFANGNPEKAAGARRRLYNSLIGLGIALVATAVVSFIGKQIGQ